MGLLFLRWSLFQLFNELRDQSYIFSVDRGINQKRTENYINGSSALLQKFFIFFRLIPRSTEKLLHLFLIILMHFKKANIHLILFNAGLYQTWNATSIHMTS